MHNPEVPQENEAVRPENTILWEEIAETTET
jgi:hypothetical protein